MPRTARFAPSGLFLHLTQRGNYRQRVFFTDQDRPRYLQLLEQHSAECQVLIAGFCLMSNHIHLPAKGDHEGAISEFMKRVNGEYAQGLHRRLGCKSLFYSSVWNDAHLTTVLRYIERNPVRTEMVSHAAAYQWSSALAHLQEEAYRPWADEPEFRTRRTPQIASSYQTALI